LHACSVLLQMWRHGANSENTAAWLTLDCPASADDTCHLYARTNVHTQTLLSCLLAPPSHGAGEDIEERSALERRFHELCEREMVLMAEIATLREVVAA
jgi:hypothetical protein